MAAAFLCERWDWDADDTAVVAGVEAERLVVTDGGGDGLDVAGVERGDKDHIGLWGGDIGGLVERKEGAVNFDADAVEHGRMSAAGADFIELVFKAIERVSHLLFVGGDVKHFSSFRYQVDLGQRGRADEAQAMERL